MKKILLLLVLFPSVLLSQAPEISQKSLQDINAINRSKAFIPKDEILLRELPIMLMIMLIMCLLLVSYAH